MGWEFGWENSSCLRLIDCGSRGVHFDDWNKGTPFHTDIVTHLSCNCGGSDINSTWSPLLYHQHTSLLSHCLTRVHTHPLSTGK